MPDLCLTLAETSLADLERKISAYAGRVAFIEVRLDWLDPLGLPRLPSDSSTRFVATLRPRREGGRYSGGERERLELLRQAAQRGFHWIDLEHDAQEAEWPDGVHILRSVHRFSAFPDSLDGLASLLEGRGEVSKIAVQVSTTRELVRLLDWRRSQPKERRLVVLGMGELGRPSRFLGALLGNQWTYVSEGAQPVAPGQFSLQQAQAVYRLAEQSNPRLYGVLGNPVAHSLSPRLHNALFRHYGIQALYLPLPVDELAPWFEFVERSGLGFRGFSVTLPFKTDVMRFLARNRSPIDSINTLTLSDAGWEGHNTDYAGFLLPLERRLRLMGKSALVLGNGGVARTVVRALRDRGCRVTVAGRNPEKVRPFADETGCRPMLMTDLPVAADLCVNATPVGQHPSVEESPLEAAQLDFEWVYDLVYRPRRTHLLQMAGQKGIQTISGLEMFVEQAALQFQLWTGIDPQRELIETLVTADPD